MTTIPAKQRVKNIAKVMRALTTVYNGILSDMQTASGSDLEKLGWRACAYKKAMNDVANMQVAAKKEVAEEHGVGHGMVTRTKGQR